MSFAYGFPILQNSTRAERFARRELFASPNRLLSDRRSLVTITVPQDSVIYHGNTEEYEENELFDGALFFGSHETALAYGRFALNRTRCRAFKTLKDLNLIDFADRRNFHVLINEAKHRHLNYHIIEEYSSLRYRHPLSRRPSSEDIRINTRHGELSELMVEFVCRLGFDGWIIPHDRLLRADQENSIISAEMLICNVIDNVEDIGDCRHFSRSLDRYFE